jgi:signal transduction histidine kinase
VARTASNGIVPPPADVREFADELAHEIRTPLAQIRLVVETMLAGRVASEFDREQALESIDREAERLGELTESLLLVLRSGERDPYPVRRPLDLGTLLEDALAGRSGAPSLHLDPPPGLIVAADPFALRLAFANLAEEALVRAADDSRTKVEVYADGDEVVVEFRASGHDVADHATGVDQRRGGFRIVVAERILLAHGGTLSCAPGRSRIRVRLPLAAAVAGTTRSRPAEEPVELPPKPR